MSDCINDKYSNIEKAYVCDINKSSCKLPHRGLKFYTTVELRVPGNFISTVMSWKTKIWHCNVFSNTFPLRINVPFDPVFNCHEKMSFSLLENYRKTNFQPME